MTSRQYFREVAECLARSNKRSPERARRAVIRWAATVTDVSTLFDLRPDQRATLLQREQWLWQ